MPYVAATILSNAQKLLQPVSQSHRQQLQQQSVPLTRGVEKIQIQEGDERHWRERGERSGEFEKKGGN